MKKFYMTMAAVLFGATAMAQIGSLSCGDVTATAGGETAYFEVMLETENVDAVSGIQFYFSLPEGVTIAQVYDEDEEGYVTDVTFPIAKKAHQVGIKATADGYMVYLGGDKSLSYKAATNPVAKIGISVAATATDGTYDVVFNKAALSDKSTPIQSFEVADFTSKLTITGGTGINDIKALDSKAPVYNLAGQRVSKTQKGVYVQSGKKVAVK
jgi:hypothetical protein